MKLILFCISSTNSSYYICNYLDKMHSFIISFPILFALFHAHTYSSADHNGGGLLVQMWQHETFIHFGYITVDIIGCVDGKYEHNSADATCQDFAKIPLRSPLSIYSLPSRPRPSSHPLATHLSLSPSNVTLSDDVISYRVLYISQRISGGRLRFARHSAGE